MSSASGDPKAYTIRHVRKRHGRLEYRRRVPDWLRPIVGQWEWVVRLRGTEEQCLGQASELTRKHDSWTSPEARERVRRVGGGTEALLAMRQREPIAVVDDDTPTADKLLADSNLSVKDMRLALAMWRFAKEVSDDAEATRMDLEPFRRKLTGEPEMEPEPGTHTLQEVVRRWERQSGLPETTRRTYGSRIRRAIEFFGAGTPTAQITPARVRAWRDAVAELPGPQGLSTNLRTASMATLTAYRKSHPTTTQPIMAKSVGDHLKAFASVMSWAVGEGIIDTNPCAGVKAPKDERDDIADTMHPGVPWRAMPEFMAELRSTPGNVARALEFTILTGVRSTSAVGLDWSELDTTRGLWTCPARRVKGWREAHIIPLSSRALECLEAAGSTVGSVWGKLPANGMLNLLQRKMGRSDVVVHGFRSSFSTWANEATEYPAEMVEFALAHKVGTEVSRRYRRESMVERRRALMEDWASFCIG